MEHPENIKHLKTIKNLIWLKPEKKIHEVLNESGYPIISKINSRKLYTLQNRTGKNEATRNLYLTGYNQKGEFHSASMLPPKYHDFIDAGFKISHKCCDIMKKDPLHKFEKEFKLKAYVATMAADSDGRKKIIYNMDVRLEEKMVTVDQSQFGQSRIS
jgi:hypothetical protein